MEPDKNKQKPDLAVVFFFLLLISVICFLYLIYKSESNKTKSQPNNQTNFIPSPQINTGNLPPAKVGEKYKGEMVSNLTGADEDLKIYVDSLPDGLAIGKCSQELNTKLIPTPNTQEKCLIEGIPTKAGIYHLKVSVFMGNDAGNIHTIVNTIDLTVLESQTSK